MTLISNQHIIDIIYMASIIYKITKHFFSQCAVRNFSEFMKIENNFFIHGYIYEDNHFEMSM